MRPYALAVVLACAPPPAAAEPGRAEISIDDAMALALRTSRTLAVSRAATERARAGVVGARSGWLPQVAASGSYVRTFESEYDGLFSSTPGTSAMTSGLGALPFGARHAWRAGLDVTQSLWDGGRTRGTVERARSTRRQTMLDERARRAQVVLEATELYFDVLLAERLVAIGDASLALADRTYKDTRARFDQGVSSEFEVLRAEVARDNRRTALVRVRADRDLARVRLARVLGEPLDRALVLTTSLDDAEHVDLAPTARAFANVGHGEPVAIARARSELAVRTAQVAIARAGRMPSLSAFTSLGVVDYPRDFWPGDDWRRNWTAGVTVSVPLFTGLRTTAQIRAARADRHAAEIQLVDTRERLAVVEREAELAVDVARATLGASLRSATLARRAYAIADVRYGQGMSTLLELADARLALDQARVNAAAAARDLHIARVRRALVPALPLPEPTPVIPTPTPTMPGDG